MARWQITLRDPLNQIPDVVMEAFAPDGYSRSPVNTKTFAEFTANGTGLIEGPTGGTRYLFNVTVDLALPDALRLEAMAELQNERLDAGSATHHLLLIDEVEELPPVTSQPRPLIGSTTTSYGKTYGFGTFQVKLDFPQNPKKWNGREAGVDFKLITFTATEVSLP